MLIRSIVIRMHSFTLLFALQEARALTPRPPRELPAVERLLGADGLATLKAAIVRHRCALQSCHAYICILMVTSVYEGCAQSREDAM